MDRSFYVYCYLDPRKPGHYKYQDKYEFDYEPFYIGKGKNGRKTVHLQEAKNNYKTGNQLKSRLIRNIWKEGKEPIIITYTENLTEAEALDQYEIPMIKTIGRRDKKLGPLTNLTDGGEGASGHVWAEDSREKISKIVKKYYENPDNRKKTSKIVKKYYENPDNRKKTSEAGKKYFENPDNRKKHSEVMKKCFENPDYRKKVSVSRSKSYIVVSPDGDTMFVDGLASFCREVSISYGSMCAVSAGRQGHYHGWKVRRI